MYAFVFAGVTIGGAMWGDRIAGAVGPHKRRGALLVLGSFYLGSSYTPELSRWNGPV